jgi:hypothetical protein
MKKTTIKISHQQLDLLNRSIKYTAREAHYKLSNSIKSYYDEDAGVRVNPHEMDAFERTACFAIMSIADMSDRPIINLINNVVKKINETTSFDSSEQEKKDALSQQFILDLDKRYHAILFWAEGVFIQSIFVYIRRDKKHEIDNVTVLDQEYYESDEAVELDRTKIQDEIIENHKIDLKNYKKLADKLGEL